MSNTTNIVGPSSKWEPSNKTLSIRTTTWKRLQKYHTRYGQTYDNVINDILDEKEKIIDSDAGEVQKNSKIGEFKI